MCAVETSHMTHGQQPLAEEQDWPGAGQAALHWVRSVHLVFIPRAHTLHIDSHLTYNRETSVYIFAHFHSIHSRGMSEAQDPSWQLVLLLFCISSSQPTHLYKAVVYFTTSSILLQSHTEFLESATSDNVPECG